MSDTTEAIATRLAVAKKETAFKNRYDHIIVNDKLQDAYKRLKKIVKKETEVL